MPRFLFVTALVLASVLLPVQVLAAPIVTIDQQNAAKLGNGSRSYFDWSDVHADA